MIGIAITMIPSAILRTCTYIVSQMVQIVLLVSFLIATAYYLGWIHRFLWHLLESESSKLLNGTVVTVGSMKVDIIRGRLWVSNLVLHSPRRQAWKWQSPVQARIGKLYVECNLVSCIAYDWFLREALPLEIYTLEMSDIQAFVERKQNILNFYLMDPHVVVPDPVLDDDDMLIPSSQKDVPIDTSMEDPGWELERGSQQQQQQQQHDHDTAERLVGDMVRALGRATQQGSLHGALLESRQRIKSQLKALQTTKKSEAMQEGVKIVQQVSKSLVEKTQNVHNVVQPVRQTLANEKEVSCRVGRVIIEDARIFTRDHHFEQQQQQDGTTTGETDTDAESTGPTSSTSSSSSWNKPIYIQRVAIRAAEMCPPLSARDDKDYPVVYQPIDKCLEVVWKRVLTECAKSNTGRLFQTAMGEVLDYWIEKGADVSKSQSN